MERSVNCTVLVRRFQNYSRLVTFDVGSKSEHFEQNAFVWTIGSKRCLLRNSAKHSWSIIMIRLARKLMQPEKSHSLRVKGCGFMTGLWHWIHGYLTHSSASSRIVATYLGLDETEKLENWVVVCLDIRDCLDWCDITAPVRKWTKGKTLQLRIDFDATTGNLRTYLDHSRPRKSEKAVYILTLHRYIGSRI